MGTRTRTVMFTDMENYTDKVSRADRDGLRRLLALQEELVGPIVRRYHGEVVKNLGDSFMCLFPAATDALRAALEILDLVKSGGGPNLRLGLTTGDVEEIDGDAFGDAVNLAARIQSQAPAGEAWFSGTTRACMNAAEIPWEFVGRFRFKGIAGEVDVCRAVPAHRCWLPDVVFHAARDGRLVRVRRGGATSSLLPPDPVVLLEGFVPGSAELQTALANLPVLDPANLFLAVYHVTPADRVAWTEGGRGLVIGMPAATEAALFEAQRLVSTTSGGSDTIVIETSQSADLVLSIGGLALPAVPMSEVVASYSYDLLADGRWVNRSDRAVVRVEVTPEGPAIHVTSAGVRIAGRARSLDEVVPLVDGMVLETPAGKQEYRALHGAFAGVLLGDTQMRLPVVAGQTAEVGREPKHPGLAFPDRRGQTNIRWCAGGRAARARASGFTLDRALAGRRQAAVVLLGDEIQLTPLHKRCTTWLLRADGRDLERVSLPTPIELGDYIVAGTTVVAVHGPDAY